MAIIRDIKITESLRLESYLSKLYSPNPLLTGTQLGNIVLIFVQPTPERVQDGGSITSLHELLLCLAPLTAEQCMKLCICDVLPIASHPVTGIDEKRLPPS